MKSDFISIIEISGATCACYQLEPQDEWGLCLLHNHWIETHIFLSRPVINGSHQSRFTVNPEPRLETEINDISALSQFVLSPFLLKCSGPLEPHQPETTKLLVLDWRPLSFRRLWVTVMHLAFYYSRHCCHPDTAIVRAALPQNLSSTLSRQLVLDLATGSSNSYNPTIYCPILASPHNSNDLFRNPGNCNLSLVPQPVPKPTPITDILLPCTHFAHRLFPMRPTRTEKPKRPGPRPRSLTSLWLSGEAAQVNSHD